MSGPNLLLAAASRPLTHLELPGLRRRSSSRSLPLAVSLATFFLSGRRARLDRQRQVFADAFEAVMEYREYPFIVRRRSPDEPAKERQRISGDLSRVQAKLNAFKARLLVEDASSASATRSSSGRRGRSSAR